MGSRRSAKCPRPVPVPPTGEMPPSCSRSARRRKLPSCSRPARRRPVVRPSADSPLVIAGRPAVPSPPAGLFLCRQRKRRKKPLKGTYSEAVPLRIPPRRPRGLRPHWIPQRGFTGDGGREQDGDADCRVASLLAMTGDGTGKKRAKRGMQKTASLLREVAPASHASRRRKESSPGAATGLQRLPQSASLMSRCGSVTPRLWHAPGMPFTPAAPLRYPSRGGQTAAAGTSDKTKERIATSLRSSQ